MLEKSGHCLGTQHTDPVRTGTSGPVLDLITQRKSESQRDRDVAGSLVVSRVSPQLHAPSALATVLFTVEGPLASGGKDLSGHRHFRPGRGGKFGVLGPLERLL